jgi:predicted phosphodiesterase
MPLLRFRLVGTLILLIGLAIPTTGVSSPSQHHTCPHPPSTVTALAVGDSRTPYDPDAKAAWINHVLTRRPTFFIHLGDMVAHAHPELWQQFDAEEGRILKTAIPFLPVIGNHEWSLLRTAPRETQPVSFIKERFPWLRDAPWYQYDCGPITFIALDSEFSLSPDSDQWRWLRKTLDQPRTGFRIVGVHRPPITAKPHYEWRDRDALMALVTHRVDIVLSSHVHNYERFERDGVQYIVSGGGGAPPYPLVRRPDDRYTGPSLPNFHLLRLHATSEQLAGAMLRWDPDRQSFQEQDHFQFDAPTVMRPLIGSLPTSSSVDGGSTP